MSVEFPTNPITENVLLATEWVDVDTLQQDPRNARIHSARNVATIKRSLEKFGQQKPIVVQRQTRIIGAGNGTFEAARDLGWKKICVAWSDLDEQEFRSYCIADNRTGELSQWDFGVLAEELRALQAVEENLSDLGWSDDEVSMLLNTAPVVELPTPEEGEEFANRQQFHQGGGWKFIASLPEEEAVMEPLREQLVEVCDKLGLRYVLRKE